MEAILHTMYVVAIKDTSAWEGDTPAELSMIGFWNLVVVWLKVSCAVLSFRLRSSPPWLLLSVPFVGLVPLITSNTTQMIPHPPLRPCRLALLSRSLDSRSSPQPRLWEDVLLL